MNVTAACKTLKMCIDSLGMVDHKGLRARIVLCHVVVTVIAKLSSQEMNESQCNALLTGFCVFVCIH